MPDYSLSKPNFGIAICGLGPLFFSFCAALLRYRQTKMPVMLLWFCLPVLGLMTVPISKQPCQLGGDGLPAACLITAGFAIYDIISGQGLLCLSIFCRTICPDWPWARRSSCDTTIRPPCAGCVAGNRQLIWLAQWLRKKTHHHADRRAEAALLSWHLADTILR